MYRSIDIHGFAVYEVKEYLDKMLKDLPKATREVTIIHGYHRGSSLQTYVRKTYHHQRIERKLVSMNAGETIFILK